MEWKLDVNELNIQWKYESGDGVVALCENPDHDDTHPSMFVNLIEQTYYCFSCGFVGHINSLLELTGGQKKYVPSNSKAKTLVDNEWQKKLQNPLALYDSFLIKRGISDLDVKNFGILSNKDEIVFPLRDTKSNNVIGVKIRLKQPRGKVKYLTFGEQPDYVLTRDYIGSDSVGQKYFITEGMFGLIKLHQNNINGITPLSASRYHKLYTYIKENKYRTFVIAFDPDYAGYMSAMKLLFDCRGLNNVCALNQFFDIDNISNQALQKLNDNNLSGISTKDYFMLLDKIGDVYGDGIKLKARKHFMSYIERVIR